MFFLLFCTRYFGEQKMTTYTLLYTLLAAAVLYYLCPLRLRWMLLLALSYLLYAQNGRQALAFILLTTLSTWAGALLIGRIGVRGKSCMQAGLPAA